MQWRMYWVLGRWKMVHHRTCCNDRSMHPPVMTDKRKVEKGQVCLRVAYMAGGCLTASQPHREELGGNIKMCTAIAQDESVRPSQSCTAVLDQGSYVFKEWNRATAGRKGSIPLCLSCSSRFETLDGSEATRKLNSANLKRLTLHHIPNLLGPFDLKQHTSLSQYSSLLQRKLISLPCLYFSTDTTATWS